MEYVYQDDNIKVYKDNDERYVPRVKHKSFLKIFDHWYTATTSQVNDRPIAGKTLEEALILGDYLKKSKEKLIPVIEESMDMKPSVVNNIIALRKAAMTTNELSEIHEKVKKANI